MDTILVDSHDDPSDTQVINPEQPHSLVSKFKNNKVALLVLALALGLTFSAWFMSRQAVRNSADQRFEFRAQEIENSVHDRMIVYEQVLWGGVGLFDSSDEVSREEWRKYVDALDLDKQWRGMQGMGYAIALEADEVEAHVAGIRAEGFPEYQIQPPGPRDEYSAILYLEPFEGLNQLALGIDMWSFDLGKEVMRIARDTGVAMTSASFPLIEETDAEDAQKGFLTFLPVYKSGENPYAFSTERRADFEGWVYGVFRMGDLMDGVLGQENDEIDFEIFEGRTVVEETLLFDSNGDFERVWDSEPSEFQSTSVIKLRGRDWLIRLHAGSDFMSENETNQPLYIAIGGLIINLLLLSVIGSGRRAKKLAESMAMTMTERLRGTTQDLEAQTVQLQEHTKQLERSNLELEQFAHAASHDLQEPLRSLGNYADLLNAKHLSDLDAESTRWLGYISTSAHSMTDLLRDLLGYARLNAEVGTFAPVSLEDSVDSAVANLMQAIHETGAEIVRQPMPTVIGNHFQLERLFMNLIGNAIKYRSEIRPTRIWIEAAEIGEDWRISVRDNGIGIRPEYHERVFELFRRVGKRSKYEGTGIGLAVCEKIVESHGGSIAVDSVPDRGSEFWFTIPRMPATSEEPELDLRTAALANT